MPSLPPFNPYARTSKAEPSGERLAVLETIQSQHSSEILEHKQQLGALWRRQQEIEAAGAQAVQALPSLVSSLLQPISDRLGKLEATWWQHVQPHMWKVWLGVGMLLFAWAWKRVTGEPVPVRLLLEALFRSIFS